MLLEKKSPSLRGILIDAKKKSFTLICIIQDTKLVPTIEDVGPEGNVEGSEAADGVTMLDVLQDEEELEEDAR